MFLHEGLSCAFDPRSVQKFFAYGYAPGETTVFKGVRKLAPGNALHVDIGTMQPRVESYYSFRIEPDDALARRPAADLAEQLRELIRRATRLRLEADVPLGLFLSGGIDSSAILAGACDAREASSVDAFTIGFDEESFDESAFAMLAAEHAGCRHHLRGFDLKDARALIPTVLSHLAEPFGDPSILPTSMLSAFARESVTVALSGDGGDELFAGYDPLLALRPARVYDRLVPRLAHRWARGAARKLPVSDRNMSFDFRLKRMLLGLGYPAPIRLPVWMSAIEPDEMADYFVDPAPPEELYSEAIAVWEDNRTGSDVDRALEFFTRLYLPDDILLKTDRASMMHALEVRAVFLDNDIVEFARRLPAEFKLRGGRRKWLLKEAVRGLVPKDLIERKKKGFGIPLARWLRTMSPPPVRTGALMCSQAIAERWHAHSEKRSDERLLLWSWISLQAAARGCARGTV